MSFSLFWYIVSLLCKCFLSYTEGLGLEISFVYFVWALRISGSYFFSILKGKAEALTVKLTCDLIAM